MSKETDRTGVVGTVLQAEIGNDQMPVLTTISHAAGDVVRSWTSLDTFMREGANARIYDGVHYRNSGRVGTDMRKQIGNPAIDKYLLTQK